jgi:hypothetical protein
MLEQSGKLRLWQEARDLYAAVGADEGVKESSRRLPFWRINE